MRYIFCFLLLGITLITRAQCHTFPTPLSNGRNVTSFVPKGWLIRDSVSGDFNKDGIADLVILLINDDDENATEYHETCNRPVLILQGSGSGYKVSAYSANAVLCKQCGGAFGDPYSEITLKNNILKISHYGGSAWRWSKDYVFRYQQGKWFLIGQTDYSYWSLGNCEDASASGANTIDVNFNTSKAHVIHTRENDCEPYEDKWVNFKKKALVPFNSFSVDKEYFVLVK